MRTGLRWLRAAPDALLHPQEVAGPVWRHLPLVLALAFGARAAVALAGDFVLHPDEIMQYLEPAHRLVFGNGIVFWEFFYGARFWLIPGFVAAILKLFDLLGLGQPQWYVDGVKLAFCALSLAIPAGMYCFARRHFGEATARVALVAGALWYELVGYAHKPMTEFVATALLLPTLALCVGAPLQRTRTACWAALLAVLTAAIRFQYAPIALLLLGIAWLRTDRKVQLAGAALLLLLAVGVFDALTWGGAPFHSYVANVRLNLARGADLPATDHLFPAYQFLTWLLIAGGGLSALCVVLALREPVRHGFLLALIALIVLMHSVLVHKEYRFIFAVIPLWLTVGADVLVRTTRRSTEPVAARGVALLLCAAVAIGGILNALPYQDRLHAEFRGAPAKRIGFLRGQDPIFAAYRYLARSSEARAIAQPDRYYTQLPGYYYLHHDIPFYAADTISLVANTDVATFSTLVSHLVTADPNLSIPGYSVEQQFGEIRVLSRDRNDLPVRRWREHAPIMDEGYARLYRSVHPDAPPMPPNAGVRFADETQPAMGK